MTDSAPVRNAELADRRAMVATLAAAFHDDPIVRFTVREGPRRQAALRVGFEKAVEIYSEYGLSFVASGGAAVALWARHDQWRLPFWRELALLPVALRYAGLNRLSRLVRGFDEMKSRHPGEPHYYLYLLGAHPDQQSRGLGSALLRHMLERCDREGSPAYLEATNVRNVPLYLRHGFQVTGELAFGPGGPVVTAMWRPSALMQRASG